MRDLIAGLLALGLFLLALGLASTLRFHRRTRDRERNQLLASGRTVLAEIPAAAGLELFTADEDRFYWGAIAFEKNDIRQVQVLVNGLPLASHTARRHPLGDAGVTGSFADQPEGIAHDRWDVLVRTGAGDTLVECGSIRERVSQELARCVFDAVKADMERRDLQADTAEQQPTATTPALEHPPWR